MEEIVPGMPVVSGSIRLVLAGAYMGICAWQDFKSRRISIRLTAWAGAAAIFFNLPIPGLGSLGLLPLAAALLPGAFFLLLSLSAKQAAGRGDGLCFLVLGALTGPRLAWLTALGALFLASLGGIILMSLKKADRKTRLPFLSFAAASWAGSVLICLSRIAW